MIPLFVGLAGKKVVIFGGGDVAARKAAYFSKEAEVVVVSRSHSKGVTTLPVKRKTLDVAAADDAGLERMVRGAFAVVAALPDKAQNNRIGRICARKRILFNNADGEPGDLILPSVSAGEQFTIAVATQGKSPAVSRFIREHLDRTFADLDGMIALQQVLRSELKGAVPSQADRRAVLHDVLRDTEVWESLGRSQEEALIVARRKYLHA